MDTKSGDKYLKYTPWERFMLGAYRDIDKAIKKEFARLKLNGIAPACQKGCYSCCRQKIPLSLPESHVLGQYIKRNFSAKQKDGLRERTSEWLDWVQNELPKYGKTPEDEMAAFCDHGPYCPLLVDGACSAYTARPFVCRTHFTFSSPEHCRSYDAVLNAPNESPLTGAILDAVKPFAISIQQSVEANNVNFEETMVLVPQALASEFGMDTGNQTPRQI